MSEPKVSDWMKKLAKGSGEANSAARVPGFPEFPYGSGDLRPSKAQSDAEGYPQLESLVRKRVAGSTVPLFTTSVTGLFDHFLANLPEGRRQHYNCDHCRAFVDKYGGLVTINETGRADPVLWMAVADPVPPMFAPALAYLADKVRSAKVTGVFVSSDPVWGCPVSKAQPEAAQKKMVSEWTHLSGENPNVWKGVTETADQYMARCLEEYKMLRAGLADYPETVVAEAVRVLSADGALDRSEKALERAQWLLALHRTREELGRDGQKWDRILWRRVATAPAGWCHVRSAVFATLMDDIKAGLPFEAVKRRWDEKMHPLQYRRPTAAPSEGQIRQAETLVSKMAAEFSFDRRFARLEDVVPIVASPDGYTAKARLWVPVAEKVEEGRGGMFDHLRRDKGPKVGQLELPARRMTWEKFEREVLPNAKRLDFLVPAGLHGFFAFVTNVHPEAPPILQWDGLEADGNVELPTGATVPARIVLPRNPVSWYVRTDGSHASQWCLTVGSRVRVNLITGSPAHWQKPDRFTHFPKSAFLILDGAKEATDRRGANIFPECLRAEFHGISKVIEAHSQSLTLAGREEASACGYAFMKGSPFSPVTLIAHDGSAEERYLIDRWD